MANKEAIPNEYPIPINYDGGLLMFGRAFKAINFIEGGVLGAIGFGIGYKIFQHIYFESVGTKIGFLIIFFAIPAVLGIRGINNESLLSFLKHLFQYQKRKRTAYYNPRIKTEMNNTVATNDDDKHSNSELPRDRILKLINKVKPNAVTSNEIVADNDENYDWNSMYFKDDIGIVDKPHEYLSNSELRGIQKKEEKERIRKQKLIKKGERERAKRIKYEKSKYKK